MSGSIIKLENNSFSGFIPLLIGFMVFLSVLFISVAHIVNEIGNKWTDGINNSITVQIIPDINLDDVAQVDKDGLILNARILSYGAEYPVVVTDPKSGNKLEQTIDLSKIKTKTIDILSDENGEFDYNISKHNIKFKFPTNSQSQTVSTISEYLEQTIVEVNKSRDINNIKHFIRYEFLAKDSKEFQKYIIDNTPMVLLEYEFVGEDGGAFTAGFQVGTDFFWS